MHVRVRAADGEERVVPLVSRLSSIEELRREVRDKFAIPLGKQRLFYGGKLLENGYTLHDYSIKLNDVIQLMVRADLPQQEEKTEAKKEDKIVYDDVKSNLYAVGDLIDMRDRELGAWFEGTIIRIVRDPEYVPPVKAHANTTPKSKTMTNGQDTKSPKATKNGKKEPKNATPKTNGEKSSPANTKSPNASTSSPKTPGRKRGIADYFSRTPKSSKQPEQPEVIENGVNGEENGHDESDEQMNLDTDVGVLYKINLVYDDIKEETSHYCKSHEIRPRARKEIPLEELTIGQTYMVNYNSEDSYEKGYWYDFIVQEVLKHRKSYELVGTLFLGPEAVPQNETKIRVLDKIYATEEVVPIRKRTQEQSKLMITPTEQRALALNCTSCRDNEKRPCRDCGCNICAGKDDPEKIVLCDECNDGFHMACLSPAMSELPEEDWYCPGCKRDPNDVVAPGAARQTKKANKSKGQRDWGRGMACVGKSQDCAMPANHFGPIPGIEVGMAWRFRIQLSESGVHRPPVSGIHGRDTDGAYSLVLSGGYEDDVDNGTEFTYTGSGGRDLSGNKRTADQSSDQMLSRENKALARNCAVKTVSEDGADAGESWRDGRPVRVVRSYKMLKHFPAYAPEQGIRYDGIYKVVKYYPETGKSGFRVWKYLLRRDDPNLAPWESTAKKYPIIFPEGYLEAEAEKKATKRRGSKINGTKRVLRESNYSDDESPGSSGSRQGSGAESPPAKRKRTRLSQEALDDSPPAKKGRGRPRKSQRTSSKPESPFSKQSKLKSPKSSTKSPKKSASKSPVKSPKSKLESMLTTEELESIKSDELNSKLWEECLDVCKSKGKQHLIGHVQQLFLCIICQEVAANPVTTRCQHNFCMSCLKLAFRSTESHACPYCRQDLSKDELECNERLKSALRTLLPGYDSGKK